MTHFVETMFYPLDTINSNSKVCQESLSLMKQFNAVLKQDGANGFIRGMSVTYYGSIFYGGSYFFTYPWFKVKGKELFYSNERQSHPPTLLYFMSGFVSEYIALLLYFPFETVKVRFQT